MATSFNDCLKRGCHVVYALEVEGIPYLFIEKALKRVTAESDVSSPGFIDSYGGAVVEGLIVDGQKVNDEIDREKGVARSRALNFRLAYEPLEDAGVIDNLFQKPSLLSPVAADIDTGASSFTVTAVGGGWSNPAGIYVGNEYIYATGVSHSEPTTTFSLLTRGAWGPKYDHDAGGFTASRFATDRPNIWRGRMVTLWECVVNPEGRALFDTWKSGDYCRQAWKGTIDSSPAPGSVGFEFTAQSLVRKLTQSIGFSGDFSSMFYQIGHSFNELVESEIAGTDETTWAGVTLPIYDPGDGSMSVDFRIILSDGTDETITAGNTSARAYSCIGHWADSVVDNLVSQLSSKLENGMSYTSVKEAIFLFDLTDQASGVYLKKTSTASVQGATAPYFLKRSQVVTPKFKFQEKNGDGAPHNHFRLEANFDWASYNVFPWLVVGNPQAETLQDYTLPNSGYAFAELDGDRELIRFTGGVDVAEYPGQKAIRVVERAIVGEPVNLAAYGVKLKIVSGAVGTLQSCALTMLESSGTATRGSYDTLGLGMGYAVDDDHISESDFGVSVVPYADHQMVAADDGSASFESLFGGWLTLAGTCVAQVRNSSGVIQLKPVRHEVYALSSRDPRVVQVNAADILLKGVSPLEVVSAPNEVAISTKSIASDASPDITVRSVPEIVREGVHRWEVKAPCMFATEAYNAAQRAIVLGAGQYAITLTLGPWVDIQVGDPCLLNLGNHRGTFDFDDGTVGLTEANARCMGVERDLVTLEQTCRFLLYGNTLHPALYCPTVKVTAHNHGARTVTVTSGEASWFLATETVRLYNPGREEIGTPEYQDVVVSGISGNVLTLADAPATWVADNTTRVTYPPHASSSAAQRGFFFHKSSYRWN